MVRVLSLSASGFSRPAYEFHISARARKKYNFDETLFAFDSGIVFTNFSAARAFTHKMNTVNNILKNPEKAVRAGTINAIGLIDEIFHYIFSLYKKELSESYTIDIFSSLTMQLEKEIGAKKLDECLLGFIEEFPPSAVLSKAVAPVEYLKGRTGEIENREILLEELILLELSNQNPAYESFRELFDNSSLKDQTAYSEVTNQINLFFSRQPDFGPEQTSIIEMLKKPKAAFPDSVSGQLKYIKEHWGMLLGPYLLRLLSSLDLIKEEEKSRTGGPGESAVPNYTGDTEYERFSDDKEWMPNVILIAKNVLVWMDQLSKTYGYQIHNLEDIPDTELSTLAARGFNALWLIGLWERSRASKKIKNLCGNPEAEASAYSLLDYTIAETLGGWNALSNFRSRCWQHGIRLASDMVPNHTGIDGTWVKEHPDYYIQTDYPPFPSYSFNGENLSHDPDIGIYLEDHYYDRSDAAVVFKRVDHRDGRTSYIYHGNDGTHMPWNDTAQLDYSRKEVRETVIQTIIHVARNFPIIRFDAAMTLAKKHIQRLWFPRPGSGGDIPSRSEHAMSDEEFQKAVPTEFWREVVDRVAKEVPDTLLLAEAFWMMEGYFVRTLGMHRVYNSAFMNMLKNEENAKYREIIKQTLAFDPDILKRFVNFMNNPDEETAIAQFGDGDKYFGVCILMITMPGLPMFGHGQIEGFREKYGMEYTRAYHDEQPSKHLIERHQHLIFPLHNRRRLFSGVEHFLLYDYCSEYGGVNENVFAYSNRCGGTGALVLYNNTLSEARGWVKDSVPFYDKYASKQSRTRSLGEGLGLSASPGVFTVFKEETSGLEYIHESAVLREQGLYTHLFGYQAKVFITQYEIEDDTEGHYKILADTLNGQGAVSIEAELKRRLIQPVNEAFARCLDLNIIKTLDMLFYAQKDPGKEFIGSLQRFYTNFIRQASGSNRKEKVEEQIIERMLKTSRALIELGLSNLKHDTKALSGYKGYIQRGLGMRHEAPAVLLSWTLMESLGLLISRDYAENSSAMMDQFFLSDTVRTVLERQGVEEGKIQETIDLLHILIVYQNWHQGNKEHFLHKLLEDEAIHSFIQINRYRDILWFSKDRFEDLLWWLFLVSAIRLIEEHADEKQIAGIFSLIKHWLEAEQKSEYKYELLLEQIT